MLFTVFLEQFAPIFILCLGALAITAAIIFRN